MALGTATTGGGWDLAELVKARRWRFILNLINHLPPHSRFMAEVAGDEEVAEQMLREGHTPAQTSPSLTEFDPTTRAIADLYDRVGALIRVMVASTGNKPPKVEPYRRPRLAIDQVRERHRWAKHKKLKERLLRR